MRKPLVIAAVALAVNAAVYTFGGVVYGEDGTAVTIAEDTYSLVLRMKVPQVKNNTESLGYRKMEWQTLKGEMIIKWMSDGGCVLDFANVRNENFKVRGSKVTYEGIILDYPSPVNFVYIGDNKKEKFETPCISFYLELEPSYAMGNPGEDNSFIIKLAGVGKSKKVKSLGCRVAYRFSGMEAGTQGCSCMLVGHKSPTRTAEIDGPSKTRVSDVVATYGRWRAVWKGRRFTNK